MTAGAFESSTSQVLCKADLPGPFATPDAIAARSVEFWRAAAFFITSVYTRFFSADDAFRMKSENCVEAMRFGFALDMDGIL